MPSSQYGTIIPSSSVVLGTWTPPRTRSLRWNHPKRGAGYRPQHHGQRESSFVLFRQPVWNLQRRCDGDDGGELRDRLHRQRRPGRWRHGAVVQHHRHQRHVAIVLGQIADQVAADLAIFNCVKGQTGSTSNFGVTFINGHASIYQPLIQAGTNYTALQLKINLITACTILEDPNCSTGSNVASGLYSAIQQFSGSSYTGQSKNIIIITDGAPDVSRGVTARQPTASPAAPTAPPRIFRRPRKPWRRPPRRRGSRSPPSITPAPIRTRPIRRITRHFSRAS